MVNTIIYLMGFAGVGKHTIAKELSLHINARIVDNHLINNPIFHLIPLDGKTPIPKIVWQKIAQIRDIVFTRVEEISPPDFNFIFTNELLESNLQDTNIYHRIAAIAQKRKSFFVPIRLVCNLEELCQRVSSPERATQFKMTSIKATREKFERESLFMPEHPLTQTIDVTHLSAKEVAEKIISLLGKLK
jgi:hypothetical protein